MLLVVDTGNTNVVFALYSNNGDEMYGPWRIRSDSKRSRDEYASWLLPLLGQNGLNLSDITGMVVSSVVPDANHHLRGLARQYMNIEAQFANYELIKKTGFNAIVEAPDEVGADRLVNGVAVMKEYKSPAIVVDFGTATTFDVINSDGAFIGGVISPGINLSINALHQAAAMLPRISVHKPEKVIATRTVQAMHSGVYWGYVGLIEGIVSRISADLGEKKPFVIATGGLAPVFEESVEAINAVDRNLTIKGLYHIYHSRN